MLGVSTRQAEDLVDAVAIASVMSSTPRRGVPPALAQPGRLRHTEVRPHLISAIAVTCSVMKGVSCTAEQANLFLGASHEQT